MEFLAVVLVGGPLLALALYVLVTWADRVGNESCGLCPRCGGVEGGDCPRGFRCEDCGRPRGE